MKIDWVKQKSRIATFHYDCIGEMFDEYDVPLSEMCHKMAACIAEEPATDWNSYILGIQPWYGTVDLIAVRDEDLLEQRIITGMYFQVFHDQFESCEDDLTDTLGETFIAQCSSAFERVCGSLAALTPPASINKPQHLFVSIIVEPDEPPIKRFDLIGTDKIKQRSCRDFPDH